MENFDKSPRSRSPNASYLNISNNDLNTEVPQVKLQGFIYGWGRNKEGDLSLGHHKNVSIPQPVKGLYGKVVKFINSGGTHAGVVTEDGQLLVCGSSLHGKLGIEDLNVNTVNKFHVVNALKGFFVRQVACGDYHTLCLLDTGIVYTWGGTLYKKLGQKGGKPAPVKVLSDKKVIYVDCGDFHSVALTDKGELYSWGGGGGSFNKGQCGHGHLNDIEEPQLIKALKNKFIKRVSCGGHHTMALTSDNEIYSWGAGTYGECGFGEFVDSPSPRKVIINTNQKYYQEVYNELDPFDQEGLRILDISSGGHHSLFLTNKGVFSCGYASHGQLGLKNTKNQCEPQFVYTLSNKKILQIAAGWNHSLVLTENRDVYACGYGLFGQLGLGSEESRTVFTHVAALRGKNVKNIYAGGNHSWVLLDETNPIIENYIPPSPLRSYMITPITGRSRDTSPIGNRSLYDKTNEDEDMTKKKLERVLQVVYTDNEMSHRFIRFIVDEKDYDSFKIKLDEYIKDMYSIEGGLLFHKLQNDTELIEETNGFGKMISPTNKKNTRSHTLLFVCDPKRNTVNTSISLNKIPSLFKISSTIVGDMYILKEKDIIKDETQKILCQWMLVFLERFANCVENIKFFELRPQIYS